jgi:hypothetical protein
MLNMIKKDRIEVIWRRTLTVFAIVQIAGICVFVLDLREALAPKTSTSASTLVLSYVIFLLFSGVVFLAMLLVRRSIAERYGRD